MSSETPDSAARCGVESPGHALLSARVHDARMMLSYLAQTHEDMRIDDYADLIETCRMPVEEWDAGREVRFWSAFNRLATAIHPATIETIEVNARLADGDDAELNPRRREKRKVILRYSLIGLLTILCVLAVQIYWVVGSNVVEQTLKVQRELDDYADRKAVLNDRILRLDERVAREAAESDDPTRDIDVLLANQELQRLTGKDMVELDARIDTADERLHALYQTMDWTTLKIPSLITVDGGEHTYLEFQKVLNATAVEYMLPLLLGLLGSCVYVLREIFNDIRNQTFLPEHAVGYRLRLYLGMIAGLTFAWLFTWVLPPLDGGGVGAASPLAIAFLVGYSVELLFSSLDRIIAGLSKERQAERRETATQKRDGQKRDGRPEDRPSDTLDDDPKGAS